MSTNAFARSRPRVRHQRVPKTPSYAHPRFLKLVKELVRIDEAKKKVSELTTEDNNGGHDSSNVSSSKGPTATASRHDETSSINNQSREQIANQLASHPRYSHTHNSHEHHTRGSHPRHQHAQQHINLLCCSGLGGLSYPSCVTGPNNSHGYRSLGLNLTQTTSALHDNYYRHNNNDTQEHMQSQTFSNQHNRDYGYSSLQQESSNQTNPAIHHSHHIDYSSLNKCPSSSSSTNASLGYSKSSVIQQQNPPQSDNCNLDSRQDENRSKRKRSSNDASSTARKCSPNPSSPPACSKRHKSSPEPPRPLSPAFTKCPICLLDCMDRDPSFTNTCFHLFCFVCIENWSKSKATCPLCRTKFSKIIYNIRSESCFEEKIASPLRRDDEDDRFTYEQLTAHPLLHPRNSHVEEARLLFDNLRNNDVLIPHSVFTNQVDPRQVDLGSFNSVTNNPNFSSTVPHGPFATLNYSPMGPNYIALIPSNNRVPNNSNGSAITSAYSGSVNLTGISGDSGSRPRVSRSGRYIYSRSHDLPSMDGSGRGSRTNTNPNPVGMSLDARQHHHIPTQGQHQHQNQQQQHRSTVPTIEIGPSRMSHSQNIHLPYHIPSRHNYANPSLYTRRPYANPPMDQHILDELYPQIPEM